MREAAHWRAEGSWAQGGSWARGDVVRRAGGSEHTRLPDTRGSQSPRECTATRCQAQPRALCRSRPQECSRGGGSLAGGWGSGAPEGASGDTGGLHASPRLWGPSCPGPRTRIRRKPGLGKRVVRTSPQQTTPETGIPGHRTPRRLTWRQSLPVTLAGVPSVPWDAPPSTPIPRSTKPSPGPRHRA